MLVALVAMLTLRPAQLWLAIVAAVVLASVIAGSGAVAVIAFCQSRTLR